MDNGKIMAILSSLGETDLPRLVLATYRSVRFYCKYFLCIIILKRGSGLFDLCLLIILFIFLFPALPKLSSLAGNSRYTDREESENKKRRKKSGIQYFPNFLKI